MRYPRANHLHLLLLAALLGTPSIASGEEPEQNQAAVDLAYEGKERFEAADYASALERFEKARALAGSPVFDLYVARCRKALGRWNEALVAYEEAGRHLVDGSNVSFVQAQENAKKEREELASKMPKLSVRAPHVPSATPPELHIDAEAVDWPALDVPLDPGKHVLAAKFGRESHDEVVTLSPGQKLTIELPFGQAAPAADGAETNATTEESGGKPGLSPLAWTAFGIGAAGLIVGATTGTIAIVNMNTLNGMTNDPGNDDYENLKNDTHTMSTMADVGFIVAGVGAVLGVTFALTLNKGQKKESAALDLRPAGTGLRLSGTF
jgi:hypothetical protein